MELWKEIELAQDKIRRVILHTPIQLGSQLGHNWCQSNWGQSNWGQPLTFDKICFYNIFVFNSFLQF
jgi:hypothetical protein